METNSFFWDGQEGVREAMHASADTNPGRRAQLLVEDKGHMFQKQYHLATFLPSFKKKMVGKSEFREEWQYFITEEKTCKIITDVRNWLVLPVMWLIL